MYPNIVACIQNYSYTIFQRAVPASRGAGAPEGAQEHMRRVRGQIL